MPSDKDRPNPLTQVSDLAPQGPDAAPLPSKAMSSLLPRVLAMLLPTDLANSLPPVKVRKDGSRFALVVWAIRSQRDCSSSWIRSRRGSPNIERPSPLSWPVG